MLRGVVSIQTAITEGCEFGVYRVTEAYQRFLLFSFDVQKEAARCGLALAKLLDVPFKDTLPAEQPLSTIGCNMEPTERDRDPKQSDLAIISEAILGPVSDRYLECPSRVLETANPKPRKRKVMGVGKRVAELVGLGKKDDEIIEVVLPMYLGVGREEAEARSCILWYIKESRKGKVNE